MLKNNLKKIKAEIQQYKNINMKDAVEQRLNKTLMLYLSELDNSSENIKIKKLETVVKEMGRYGN